jgi:hypothetical protein
MVVERSFAWLARFRRLARDYGHMPETLAGLHFVALALVMLAGVLRCAVESSWHTLGSTPDAVNLKA